MAEFPDAIFEPRETENLPGLVYDAADKRTMFSEDFQNLGLEIKAIEEILGTGLNNVPHVVSRLAGIDGLATGDYSFDGCPSDKRFQLIGIACRANCDGTLITPPQVSFFNSSSSDQYNFSISTIPPAGLAPAYWFSQFLNDSASSFSEVLNPTDNIQVHVDPGDASHGAAIVMEFDLIGYFIPYP